MTEEEFRTECNRLQLIILDHVSCIYGYRVVVIPNGTNNIHLVAMFNSTRNPPEKTEVKLKVKTYEPR